MGLQETAALARHETFRDRVGMAVVKAAVNVAAELPADPPDTRKDELRANLATNVLNDPDGHRARFTWAVLSNAAVAGAGLDAPDGDIEFTVASVWDAIAGV